MPRIPTYHVTYNAYEGAGTSAPGNQVVFGSDAELYESAVTRAGGAVDMRDQPRWTLLCPNLEKFPQDGFDPVMGVWRPDLAWYLNVIGWVHDDGVFVVRAWGARWLFTPAEHMRLYLHLCKNDDPPPAQSPLLVVPGGRYSTFDIYRPFGAAAPTLVAAPGVLLSVFSEGRGSYSGGNYLTWSDVLYCANTVDIRDGCSRAAGLDVTSYADGDEVRFPTGVAVTRYVVVRVEKFTDASGTIYKRVYLLRDQARWPGP